MVELPETCRETNVPILVTVTFSKILAEIRYLVLTQEDEYWSDQPHLSHGVPQMVTVRHRCCRVRKR